MRLTGLLILAVGLGGLFSFALADDAEPSDPQLRATLLEMMAVDQEARRSGDWDRVRSVDAEHVEYLRELLDTRGWPKISEVGADGALAAWLLAQHADHDVELQKRVLAILQQYLEQGEANERNVAYLEDRVAVAEDRPQTYGTQGRCRETGGWVPRELADESQVNAKRASIGLGRHEDYVAHMQQYCVPPESDEDDES